MVLPTFALCFTTNLLILLKLTNFGLRKPKNASRCNLCLGLVHPRAAGGEPRIEKRKAQQGTSNAIRETVL